MIHNFRLREARPLNVNSNGPIKRQKWRFVSIPPNRERDNLFIREIFGGRLGWLCLISLVTRAVSVCLICSLSPGYSVGAVNFQGIPIEESLINWKAKLVIAAGERTRHIHTQAENTLAHLHRAHLHNAHMHNCLYAPVWRELMIKLHLCLHCVPFV